MNRVAWLMCVMVTNYSYGQSGRAPAGISCTGIGTYSTKHQDAFSFTINQASLAQVKNSMAGIYGEKRFLLNELNNVQMAASVITSAGNFGATIKHYGFNAYKEMQIGLAHARKLDDQFDVGIQFNYNTISIPGYGAESLINAECGAACHITEQLHTGIHISFWRARSAIPIVIRTGIGYEASPLFFITGEIIKEEDQPVNINIGLLYRFIPQLTVKAGISAATASVWLGTCLLLKEFRLDVVSSYHPQLGITPGLMLTFSFTDKKKSIDK